MKTLSLLPVLSLLAVSGLFAQTGPRVYNYTVDQQNKISFLVSWNKENQIEPWSDSVWIFADYITPDGITWRVPLDASAATVSNVSGTFNPHIYNVTDKGFFLAGNAREITGDFMAKVEIYPQAGFNAILSDVYACVYAMSYPPTADYEDNPNTLIFGGTEGTFVGKITNDRIKFLEVGLVTDETGHFNLPEGYWLSEFTDATGAPGIIKCMQMPGPNLAFVAPLITDPNTPTVVTATSLPEIPDLEITWRAPAYTPSTGTGISFAAVSPEALGVTFITMEVRAAGYCPRDLVQNILVDNCVEPPIHTLSASNTVFCTDEQEEEGAIFSLSGTLAGNLYVLLRGEAHAALLIGTGSPATFSQTTTNEANTTLRAHYLAKYGTARPDSLDVVYNVHVSDSLYTSRSIASKHPAFEIPNRSYCGVVMAGGSIKVARAATVDQAPVVMGDTENVCPMRTVTLGAIITDEQEAKDAVRYAWYNGDMLIQSLPTLTYMVTESGTYTAAGVNDCGVEGPRSVPRLQAITACGSREGEVADPTQGCADDLTSINTICRNLDTWNVTNFQQGNCRNLVVMMGDALGSMVQWETARLLCPAGWELPTVEEADCIYKNRSSVPGLITYDQNIFYFTSDLNQNGGPKVVTFNNNTVHDRDRTFSAYVRCVKN